MGFFGFGKKKKKDKPGSVFLMRLLMRSEYNMPDKDFTLEIMKKYFGDVDYLCPSDKTFSFLPKKYTSNLKDGSITPQLIIMECKKTDNSHIDEITRSQMWDCPESEEILSECKYEVIATDLLAGAMEYKDRADMLMDYMEALMEIYPMCVAIQFETSGKMFTRDQIVNHQIPREWRFIHFAVNVRFFNIEGTDDMLVDSLGMSTLYLPDVQYHFHGMDPNLVVNHAYNTLIYIFDNNCPIENGETIDGIENGEFSQDVMWKCQYEDSLIQPSREVLDICMGEFAAGERI